MRTMNLRSLFFLSYFSILLSTSTVFGEKFWLSRVIRFPEPRTFEVVHYHTIAPGENTEVRVLGPVDVDPAVKKQVDDAHLQLHVLHYSALSQIESSHFCCSAQDVKDKKCEKIGKLILTDSATKNPNAFSFEITQKTLDNGFADSIYQPIQDGLYFLALSNCGEINFGATSFRSGELSLVGKSGYLPGEEAPKLSFYMYLALAYLGLLLVWGVICYAQASNMFTIHNYISAAIVFGLLEATCWYAALFHWNAIGHRWRFMIVLATMGTTVKQGACYALLLLACMGVGVTKSVLERKDSMKIFCIVLAFVISDSFRLIVRMDEELDASNREMSFLSSLMVVAPGSFFVSWLYCWILEALQGTISDLKDTKQVVKVEVYQSLRLALGIVIGIVMALFGYEIMVLRPEDLSKNWGGRWVFTDAAAHSCFFALLSVLMYLWRPNEQSHLMAYSEQIVDDDGIELGRSANYDDEDGVTLE